MFDKIFEAQQKAEESKKRLDNITVVGLAEGGKISITATANKEIQLVTIDDEFYKQADREELEELLVVALNKAMEQADNIAQTEQAAIAKDMFGGLGNLGELFGK